jgi:hypothetical protein
MTDPRLVTFFHGSYVHREVPVLHRSVRRIESFRP